MNKIKAFFCLENTTKLLFIEAYLELARARILKRLPFHKVAPFLGEQMCETSYSESDIDRKLVRGISQAINIMSDYTFWESQCLVKAIAGMKMLERRKVECTLYLGTGKDETGKMIAHAWLRSGPYYITGFEGMNRFTVIGKFAKQIRLKNEGE